MNFFPRSSGCMQMTGGFWRSSATFRGDKTVISASVSRMFGECVVAESLHYCSSTSEHHDIMVGVVLECSSPSTGKRSLR